MAIRIGEYNVPELPAGVTRTSERNAAGYSTVQGELQVRFAEEGPYTPGALLHLLNTPSPFVVIPNGLSFTNNHLINEFNDGVAELWAKQHDGIYFPSDFRPGSETEISFVEFVQAVEYMKPNEAHQLEEAIRGSYAPEVIEKYATLYEKSLEEGAFQDLHNEQRFLTKVKVFDDSRTDMAGSLVGLEGYIHDKDKEHEILRHIPKTPFGPEEGRYHISLGLNLKGFGEFHYGVSARHLVAEIPFKGYIGHRFKEKDSEAQAIGELVDSNNKSENYEFQLDFISEKKDLPGTGEHEYVDKVILSMVSPNGVSGSGVFKSHKAIGDENSKMEKPVMQTKDMLDIFEPLATKISTGLLNHIAHKKEEVQRNTDAAYTRMFGE